MLIHLQYIYCRSALSYSLSSSSTGRARKHRTINQLFPQFLDMQQTIEEWGISTRDLFLGTTVSWRVIQRTFTHPSHHPDDHSTKSTNLWSCVNSPRSSLLFSYLQPTAYWPIWLRQVPVVEPGRPSSMLARRHRFMQTPHAASMVGKSTARWWMHTRIGEWDCVLPWVDLTLILFFYLRSRAPQCGVCDGNSADPERTHPIWNCLDASSPLWWQSPTLSQGKQFEQITVTVDLGQVSLSSEF